MLYLIRQVGMKKELEQQKIVIYQKGNNVELNVRLDGETVWLSRAQLAELFGRDVKTIGKHINNALTEELQGMAVVAKFATAATDGKTYQTEHYNLEMILSVGYRVKSQEGIRFRIWASKTLKEYVLNGIVINQKRLDQLNKFVEVITRSDIAEVAGVGEMMKEYVHALHLLEAYDESKLKTPKGSKESWRLTYEEARSFLDTLREQEGFNDIFTKERDEHFKGIVAGLYQTFGGKELYSTVEEKAVNLLYQVVKDHPFFDGNKRGAAALFIFFLSKNKLAKNINSNTLAATTLLTALSEPQEHEQILLLIRNFLATDGK